jgi:hypothetical protein
MSKFKVGDKVRCINDSDMKYLKNNTIYTIVDILHDTWIYIEINTFTKAGYESERFELVKDELNAKKPINGNLNKASKLRTDLVPASAVVAIATGLTVGINKGYTAHSWRQYELEVPLAACLRHLFGDGKTHKGFIGGDALDEEGNCNLSAALCNLALVVDLVKNPNKKE